MFFVALQARGDIISAYGRPSQIASTVCQCQLFWMRRYSVAMEVCVHLQGILASRYIHLSLSMSINAYLLF